MKIKVFQMLQITIILNCDSYKAPLELETCTVGPFKAKFQLFKVQIFTVFPFLWLEAEL